MTRVFISYRRQDSKALAERIYDYLIQEGIDAFLDTHGINKGDYFTEVLNKEISSRDVMLVLIGSQWATITDNKGKKRLFLEKDVVRNEIERGFAREGEMKVIPVLIEGTEMPTEDQFPPSIRKLRGIQAAQISSQDFRVNMEALTKTIKEHASQYGGIFRVTNDFNSDDFKDHIFKANREIRILTTWTSLLTTLKPSLIKALDEKKIGVRFLLLDPDSLLAKQRSRELGENINRASQSVEENLNYLFKLQREIQNPSKLQIKLYDTIPSISIYAADDIRFVGFFLIGKETISAPILQVRGKTSLGEHLDGQFEELWHRGKKPVVTNQIP